MSKSRFSTVQPRVFPLALALWLSAFALQGQALTGTWRTVDDETGEAKSHVEVYQSGGKYYAKVTKLLREPPDRKCDKCPGERYMQPVLGMVVSEPLTMQDGHLTGGKILDPEKGKWYTCKMWLKEGDPNILVVRGYLFGFYRTQYWHRV